MDERGTVKPRRVTLRSRILLSSSALLVILIAAMLVFVNYQANLFVRARISSDLVQGRERVADAENDQLTGLRETARLVASIPSLNALLGTDLATIRDFLLSYQQQNNGPEILIVLDPAGKVVARTDAPSPEPVPDAEAHWVQPLLSGQSAMGILKTKGGVYNAAAAPAEAGGTVFGFVIAGASIDNRLARRLSEVSRDEIVIVDDRVLGSSLGSVQLPWQNRNDWGQDAAQTAAPRRVILSGENYSALATPLGAPGGPIAICLLSRDRALAPYRRIQFGLVALGLLATLAGVAGSAAFARNVTAPVAKLVEGTRQVAAGDFEFRLDISRQDEIGDLAQAFNVMIQGLQERAHMEKFVSQSTMEMIQSSSPRKVSAGERKQLTIFFSDIRGFTSMSERRQPEEVVEILNRCLSLQAQKVKKFSGDVDKFVGDAVVALFDGEDMALNAIRCAVEIHKAMEAYNAERPAQEPIHLGVGIVTGEVILGSIGSQDRLDFTVIGSHVNLCARLCSAAGPREILLSESTYRLVHDLIAAEKLEPLHAKGFSEPVPVYRMTVS